MQYIKDISGFRFKDVEARQDIEALKNKKAIIDVTELPENGIDVTSIYRLKGPEVYASFRGTQNMFYNIPISWEVVDALPAEGSACTDANESFIKLYYQRSDKLAYGYLTAELSKAEAQWMEASALWVAMNIETAEFGGYITTEDQATNSSMVYIVTPDVTYSLYHYKDGWKVVGEVTTEVVDQKIEEALEDYAKTEDIPTDYATNASVDSKIDAAVKGLLGEGVDAAYDTFVEIQKLMEADDTQSADLIAKVNKNAEDIAANAKAINDQAIADAEKYETKDDVSTKLANKVDKLEGYSLVSDAEIERLAGVNNYDDTALANKVRAIEYDYVKIADIPTKVSELENDKNYLTEIPTEYITESDLEAKKYLTSIPSEYVTETELNDKGYLTSYTETDPTVPAWAKADTKPSYTASEVGAVPTDRTVNGKALSSNITLSASDVKALPDNTEIPSALSDLSEDATHRTVTDAEKEAWNAKSNFSGKYEDLTGQPNIPSVENYYTKDEVDSKTNHSGSASRSTALGYQVNATGRYSTALGVYTNAAGSSSTALGRAAKAAGDYSTALGYQANAAGNSSTALGAYANATGNFSTALGYEVNATGVNSTALGYNTTASGKSAIVFGQNANATGNFSTALGYEVNATGSSSTALGYFVQANGVGATALGRAANAAGNFSTALGVSTKAAGDYSTALGYAVNATGVNSTALGYEVNATGDSSTALGYQVNATGVNSTALGYQANAAGNDSMALGYQANAADYSLAIGGSANASGGAASIALGTAARATVNHATALGNTATAGGVYSLAVGDLANAASSNATALGASANATGNFSTALGAYANAAGSSSTALGHFVRANGVSATALGTAAKAAGDYSTALGASANATGNYSVALGYGANVPNTVSNAIYLGDANIQTIAAAVTTITSLSDERTKEDIQLANTAQCLADIESVPVHRFKYKKFARYAPKDVHITEFIAQDVAKVFPKSIHTYDEEFPVLDENDEPIMITELDENGNIVYEADGVTERKVEKKFTIEQVMHMDKNFAIPTMWAAIQELSKRIKELETIIKGE